MQKKIILLFLSFFISKIVISQNSSLTYQQANDVSITSGIKNYQKFESYTTKNGDVIKIGDNLIIGKPSEKKYAPFTNIVKGKLKSSDLKNFDFLPANCSGNTVIVKEIMAVHVSQKNSKLWTSANPFKKNSPVYINLVVQNPEKTGGAVSLLLHQSRRTIIDLEKSMEIGEVVNPSAKMTKEQAIAKLKESKDLMELDLMDKSEYQKLKEKLTPIIMGD